MDKVAYVVIFLNKFIKNQSWDFLIRYLISYKINDCVDCSDIMNHVWIIQQ